MADIDTSPGTRPVPKPTITVSTKAGLTVATGWTEQPDLRCQRVMRMVNGMDTATLTFEPGTNVRQIGSSEQGVADAFDWNSQGRFVKVEFTDDENGDFEWIGYQVDADSKREPESPQVFTAVGLEYFLDRTQVAYSYVDDGKKLGRVIPFNQASGAGGLAVAALGNRSTGTPASGVPEFANADDSRGAWSVKEILQYLLHYFHPVDNLGLASPCDWDVNLGTILDDYVVSFDPRGRTLYEIVNALVSPRRSLCWWLDYTDLVGTSGTATIQVASLNQAEVTLPGGGTLPANANQVTLDFDADPTVKGQRLASKSRGSYKAIRTRGARITSTFSGSVGDEFATDWTPAIENQYDAAAAATTGYAGLDAEEKQRRNDAFRRDERFYRVYQAFRLDAAWDGKADTEWVFPDDLAGGAGTASLTFLANWLRLLPHTLLAAGANYADTAAISYASPTTTADDLLAPFAVVEVATSPSKYQYVEKLVHADYVEGTPAVDNFSASFGLRVETESPGILLRASNGLNHMLAANHFAGAEPTGTDPELDYDTLIFTVSVEADHFAEAVYPTVVPSGTYEELLIEVGDAYRLDYLVPGTVVRLDNGDLVTTNGGTIRDDRSQLEDIARFAYEWYQAPKQTLTVSWAQLRTWFELGMMLTTLGTTNPTTLGTVIGQITYDLAALTTQIQTIGDELQIREVV